MRKLGRRQPPPASFANCKNSRNSQSITTDVSMEMSLTDIIGLLGVAMLLWAYALLQIQSVKFDDYVFLGMNALGSSLIILSLLRDFNLSALFIEAAWVAVSLFGIYRRWKGNAS